MEKSEILKNFSPSFLSHAYLILLKDSKERKNLGREISEKLQISPSDLILVERQIKKNNVSIAQVHELQKLLYFKPHSSDYKLAVILEAEQLSLVAQNALLKILEEPPAKSVIVLFAENKFSLLETVVSRCRVLFESGFVPQKFEYQLPLKFNDIKERMELAEKLSKKENISEILEQWLWQMREKLLGGSPVEKQIEILLWARSILNTNVNRRVLLENILLEM